MEVHDLWRRWFKGHEIYSGTTLVRTEEAYRKFSFLTKIQAANLNEDLRKLQGFNRVNYSKAKGVIKALMEECTNEVTEGFLGRSDDAFLNQTFDVCWTALKAKLNASRRKAVPSQCSYASVMNFITEAKKNRTTGAVATGGDDGHHGDGDHGDDVDDAGVEEENHE